MRLKLYEIDKVIEQILEAVYLYAEENEGEIPDNLDEMLERLEFQREKKILDIARYYKSLTAEAEAIKMEYMKLQKRQKTIKNFAYRLKTYLKINLHTGEKLKDDNTIITWRKSEQVKITDPDLLLDDYCKIERTPVLSFIKDHLKKGMVVEGAMIVQNSNLQIK